MCDTFGYALRKSKPTTDGKHATIVRPVAQSIMNE